MKQTLHHTNCSGRWRGKKREEVCACINFAELLINFEQVKSHFPHFLLVFIASISRCHEGLTSSFRACLSHEMRRKNLIDYARHFVREKSHNVVGRVQFSDLSFAEASVVEGLAGKVWQKKLSQRHCRRDFITFFWGVFASYLACIKVCQEKNRVCATMSSAALV